MSWQPDEQQQQNWGRGPTESLVAAIAKVRNFADRLALSNRMSAPVTNTPYIISWPIYTGTAADTFLNAPQILVPANKNRISLIVQQVAVEPNPVPTFAASYSWGYPAVAPVVGAGRAFGPLVPGYCLLPTRAIHHLGPLGNGTISEDALWITLDKIITGGLTGYSPGFVLAYEGALALEAPRNRRAA
jgi:hypothetical protein